MIQLGFTINREIIKFNVDGKRIIYFDKKWPNGIMFMPKDSELVKYLLTNQRKYPLAQQIITWLNEANSGSNLEEYDKCANEEEVANIVKRDALSRGLVEIQ